MKNNNIGATKHLIKLAIDISIRDVILVCVYYICVEIANLVSYGQTIKNDAKTVNHEMD